MNIVVCYKIVPDEEGIAIKADRSVDVSGAQWSLGEYDLEALEAAVQLRDSVGGKVTVLTVGGDEVLNSKLKKVHPVQRSGRSDSSMQRSICKS